MIKLAQPTFGISSDSQKYAHTLTSNPSRQTVLSIPTNIFLVDVHCPHLGTLNRHGFTLL